MARLGRSQPIQPQAFHGLLDSGVGVPGTGPPPALVVTGDDRRQRLPTPAPVVISAAYIVTPAAPTATPPVPFIVPVEVRRRILESIPDVGVGFDNIVPPEPNVIEPASKRRLPPDPFFLNPALVATTPPPSFAAGPQIIIVPLDQRGRFLVGLPSTGQHGFVDPGPAAVGTTPPPATAIDRVDQRVRYKPQEPLVLSGVLAPPPEPSAPQTTYNFGAFLDRGFMYERDHGKRKFNELNVRRRRRA